MGVVSWFKDLFTKNDDKKITTNATSSGSSTVSTNSAKTNAGVSNSVSKVTTTTPTTSKTTSTTPSSKVTTPVETPRQTEKEYLETLGAGERYLYQQGSIDYVANGMANYNAEGKTWEQVQDETNRLSNEYYAKYSSDAGSVAGNISSATGFSSEDLSKIQEGSEKGKAYAEYQAQYGAQALIDKGLDNVWAEYQAGNGYEPPKYNTDTNATDSTETSAIDKTTEEPKYNTGAVGNTIDKTTEEPELSYEEWMKKYYADTSEIASNYKEDGLRHNKATYEQSLANANALERMQQPTYGSQAETLGQMGLTGSGYGEYLSGQATANKRALYAEAGKVKTAADNEVIAKYADFTAQSKKEQAESQLKYADYINSLKQQGIDNAQASGGVDLDNSVDLSGDEASYGGGNGDDNTPNIESEAQEKAYTEMTGMLKYPTSYIDAASGVENESDVYALIINKLPVAMHNGHISQSQAADLLSQSYEKLIPLLSTAEDVEETIKSIETSKDILGDNYNSLLDKVNNVQIVLPGTVIPTTTTTKDGGNVTPDNVKTNTAITVNVDGIEYKVVTNGIYTNKLESQFESSQNGSIVLLGNQIYYKKASNRYLALNMYDANKLEKYMKSL